MISRRRSRSSGSLRQFSPSCGLLLAGLVVFGTTLGCGIVGNDGLSADPSPSFPDTVVDDSTDGDDILNPSGTGETTVRLSFTASPVFCCDALSVEFQASVGSEGRRASVSFHWDFGDGRTGVGQVVEHTYPWAGMYVVALTARLSDGGEFIEERILSLRTHGTSGTEMTLDPPGASTNGLFVDAGSDQQVVSGDIVTLTGRVTGQAGGASLTYAWTQIDGPAVDLAGPTSVTTSFVAPAIGDDGDVFTFELTVTEDGREASDEVVVNVVSSPDDANRPPTVADEEANVIENESATLTLHGVDPDGDELTFLIARQPVHGAVHGLQNAGPATAELIYVPDADFVGTDTLTYQAYDGIVASNVGMLTIDVLPFDMALSADQLEFLVPLNTAGLLTLTASGSPETDLTFTVASLPRHGTVGPVDNSALRSASVVYTPDDGYRGMDSFEVLVSDGVSSSEPATITIEVMKLFAPWVEFNGHPMLPAANLDYGPEEGAEPGWTLMDYVAAGLEEWAPLTRTAIVTTRKERLEQRNLYPALMQRKPRGMTIIGGIKTSTYLPGVFPFDAETYDFADSAGWQLIAEHAELVAADTGVNITVLENEGAITPFLAGVSGVDLERFRQALQPLSETGVEFWWYLPQVASDAPEFPDRLDRTTEMVTIIKEVLPQSKFATIYASFAAWAGHRLIEPYRNAMVDLVGLPNLTELMYVTPSGWMGGQYYYDTAEAVEGLRTVLPPDNLNLIYPGATQFINLARDLRVMLPPLAQVNGPN